MGKVLRFPTSPTAAADTVWRQTAVALVQMFDIYRAAREAIALGDLGAGKPAAEDIDAVEIPPGLGLLAHAVVRTFQTEWMSEILRASVEAQDERQRLEAERRAADPA